MSEPSAIIVPAPGKLNITLAVGPIQSDGYHLIDSVMAPLDLADEVVLSESAGGIRLTVAGPTACDTPTDASNLAWRAAELMAAQAGRPADLAIHIIKNIPVGGGLAGGSADAAAVIVGLNRMWGLNWPTERLIELGARLGSDVPFCVVGQPARVRGRGQIVTPIDRPLPPFTVVLILPGMAVSTRQVYARLDEIRSCEPGKPERKHTLAGLEFYNQLQDAALRVCPELGDVFEILEHLIGVPRLTVAGSGSTLFAPFTDRTEATGWKERIESGLCGRSNATCRTLLASVQERGASNYRRLGRIGRAGQACSDVQGVSDGRQRSEDQTGGPPE